MYGIYIVNGILVAGLGSTGSALVGLAIYLGILTTSIGFEAPNQAYIVLVGKLFG